MSRKKTTFDEKKTLLLSLFKETEDVYNLKELEKAASREKGIPQNTIKDVLQALLDDDAVEQTKIGAQEYYWLFNAKASKVKQTELNELNEKLDERKKYLDNLDEKVNKLESVNFDGADDLIKKLDKLKEKSKTIQDEFKNLNQSGDVKKIVEETNEWTDNIFLIKSYVKGKLKMDSNALDKEFGIPKDLDYL